MFRLILFSALLTAQTLEGPDSLDYVCPMDPEVRSAVPGSCPRCGMKLKVGVPDLAEYVLELETEPRVARSGESTEMVFDVFEPDTSRPVKEFETVHEKLFHLFVVGQDLDFFLHEHPQFTGDYKFRFKTRFPKAGMYRVLCDFYPKGGTPQLLARTLFVSDSSGRVPLLESATLRPDLAEKQGGNMAVKLETQPGVPIAGMKTLMFFRVSPSEGLEQYLGTWAHMLAVSDDLVDVMHSHPFLADGGPQVQFNMIFPRARTYRIWVQFQRQGTVNTVAFNVPVSTLE